MKANRTLLTIAAFLLTLAPLLGQSPPAPSGHRIDTMTTNSDHTMSLGLAGDVPSLFAPYYDIYMVEASTNLVDWSPLAILQRTNASSDALSYRDPDAANVDNRFYRTPPNALITPFPKPSGPYTVGTVSRLVTDPSRTNRYIPGNSSFMVRCWYPAESRAGVLPDAYAEKKFLDLNPFIFVSPGTVAQLVSHACPGLPLAATQALFAKATNDAFWFQIQNSTHPGFDDTVALINEPTSVSRGQSQAIKACMLAFFNRYLKNQDEPLLDNPAAVYPDIINFQKK